MKPMLRRWVRVLTRTILGCVAAGVIAIMATTLFITSKYQGTAELPADCGIVFGAAVYGKYPGPAVQRRVAAAVEQYRQGNIKRLFLTGGKGGKDILTEAQAMQQLAIEQGVDPNDIALEEHARSTWENILFTRPLTTACTSVVGISDAFHLARIELLARRQGWGSLTTFPAELHPTPRSEQSSLFRESAAYMYYFFHMDQIWNAAPTSTVQDALGF